MKVRWQIVAFSAIEQKEIVLFHWTRRASDGIARARRDAVKFGRADELSCYVARRRG
jgi:hypothetical protein